MESSDTLRCLGKQAEDLWMATRSERLGETGPGQLRGGDMASREGIDGGEGCASSAQGRPRRSLFALGSPTALSPPLALEQGQRIILDEEDAEDKERERQQEREFWLADALARKPGGSRKLRPSSARETTRGQRLRPGGDLGLWVPRFDEDIVVDAPRRERGGRAELALAIEETRYSGRVQGRGSKHGPESRQKQHLDVRARTNRVDLMAGKNPYLQAVPAQRARR